MNTTTRTARRPFRAAITAAGFVPTKECFVYANHGYYFGGSSSPRYTIVLAVTADTVIHVDTYKLDVSRTARWIFEDLVSTAGETMRKDAARTAENAKGADTSKAMGRVDVQIAKACADRVAAHGAPVDPANYNRVRVELVAGEGVDVYSYANGLGTIVDYNSGARTAAVECSQGDVNDYANRFLRSGERFDLRLSVVATLKECPRA